MPNIEFGEWIHVDTTPKTKPKRKYNKIVKKEIVPIVVMSNMCAEGKHTLCVGTAWHVTKSKYVPCQCTCGCIAADNHAADEAFQDFFFNADRDVDPEIYEANAFYAGWKAARKYYNV
jgi:hypothetical protein